MLCILILWEFLNDRGIALLNLDFAHAYRLKKDYDKSKEKVLEAKDIFKKLGDEEMVKKCDEVLDEIEKLIESN